MDYQEFMSQAQHSLTTLTESEKNQWILDFLASIPKEKRSYYLHSLNNSEIVKAKQSHMTPPEQQLVDQFDQWFTKIEAGSLFFQSEWYEDDSEDYWEEEWISNYTDDSNICQTIHEISHFALQQLEKRNYSLAFDLLERLCTISFMAIEEHTEEEEELTLETLVSEGIISLPLKEVIASLMYCDYQVSSNETRAQNLLYYFSWPITKEISLQDIFEAGPEPLPNKKAFLKSWQAVLKKAVGNRFAELLAEAIITYEGIDALTANINHLSGAHPSLYLLGCQELINLGRLEDSLALGQEALNTLPSELAIRAQIANLIVPIAESNKKTTLIRKCYYQAFISDPTLSHYLRLSRYVGGKTKINELFPQFEDALMNIPVSSNQSLITEWQPTMINPDQLALIYFFNGQFDQTLKACRNNPDNLGWSTSFKGTGIHLFLFLLSDPVRFTTAQRQLLAVLKIRTRSTASSSPQLFIENCVDWRKTISLTDKQRQQYLNYCQQQIEQRLVELIDTKYRSSYPKAALLIVALGEALEVSGMAGAKQAYCQKYLDLHKRKYAFTAELKVLMG